MTIRQLHSEIQRLYPSALIAIRNLQTKRTRGATDSQILEEAKMRHEAISAGLVPRGAALVGTTKKGPEAYVSKAKRLAQSQAGTVQSQAGNLRSGVYPSPREIDRITVTSNGTSKPGETIVEAELRNKIALANANELKVSQMRGELVPVAKLNTWFSGLVIRARDVLMSIGPELQDRLGIDLAGVELIENECRRALEILEQHGKIEAHRQFGKQAGQMRAGDEDGSGYGEGENLGADLLDPQLLSDELAKPPIRRRRRSKMAK